MALICYSVEITHQFKCHLERIEANQYKGCPWFLRASCWGRDVARMVVGLQV